jgi:esterase/lipase
MEEQTEEQEENEEIFAYPNVSMLSDIEINGEDTPIKIGGWNMGGFSLEEPYMLKEEKGKNIVGKYMTYYKIVKDRKLQSEREKRIRENAEKRRKEDIEYYENSIKDAKDTIEHSTNKLKELNSEESVSIPPNLKRIGYP